MTDTPEIAAWLTRFEKKFGETQTASALQQLKTARELFYSELGYNVTRRQFEALKGERNFRDLKTGRFLKALDVQEMILQSHLDSNKVRPEVKYTDAPKPRRFNRSR